ncbi:MAG: Lin0512 family protein [Rhodospirillaceae bacterium]
MTLKRMVLEIGTGNDLHGGDYTKAAVRAVEDAMHHSSLTMIRSLGIAREAMHVDVTVGVQKPEKVDTAAVKAAFPYGQIEVRATKGGLDVPDDEGNDLAVIASAAIVVRVDLP